MYYTSCHKKAGDFGWGLLEHLAVSKARIFGISLLKSRVLTISTEIAMQNDENMHSQVRQLTPH